MECVSSPGCAASGRHEGDRERRVHRAGGDPAGDLPQGEVLLFGAEDVAKSRIHASNEGVDPAEIERLIVAEALMLDRIGGR